MKEYVFHGEYEPAGVDPVCVARRLLASHVAASVASFDLMRADPRLLSITVSHDGRVVLSRRRDGGKLVLVWAERRGLQVPRSPAPTIGADEPWLRRQAASSR